MNRVVIAEDEKMILQGIHAMVSRAPIEVEEIIDCRDGQEAFDVISSSKVDVLITDIRMPKMDGITLVKEIQKLKDKPRVIVISGYDDFSYAVELLRCGAKEYLLKPIQREDIYSFLSKMQEEITLEEEDGNDEIASLYEQMKILLSAKVAPPSMAERVQKQAEKCFENTDYVIICTNFYTNEKHLANKAYFFDNIGGQNVLVAKPGAVKELAIEYLEGAGTGASKAYHSLLDAREAFFEARRDREIHYCRVFKKQIEKPLADVISDSDADRMIQLIGTARLEEAEKFFTMLINKVKYGELTLDAFSKSMVIIVKKIEFMYEGILKSEELLVDGLKDIFLYRDIDDYYENFTRIINVINQKMKNDYEDYQYNVKMGQAVEFVRSNYQKDINMAMVSNEISMNYSAFSLNFKEYTGENFSSYLKDIRMKEAKRLLDGTDKKVIEISALVGYDNEKHFMKSFKLMYGVTPSEYRKNLQTGR